MVKKLSFKTNDLVVRRGKVLKVSHVTKTSLNLKPFFQAQSNSGLTFTLTIKNAQDGHIRHLTSSKKIKDLINQVIAKKGSTAKLARFDPKIALSSNQLKKTLIIIKTLWLEKQQKGNVLPSGKSNLLKLALLQASEEISARNSTPVSEIKSLLLSSLQA